MVRSCWLWGAFFLHLKSQSSTGTIQSHRRLLCRQIIHILLLQAQPPIHQGLAAMVAVSLPKALTTYITSQISRAVRSVDWSNDTESGASAIKALIGMAGLVKERLQTEESGPDSGSSDGGESKNAAGEITIKVSRCKEARHTV